MAKRTAILLAPLLLAATPSGATLVPPSAPAAPSFYAAEKLSENTRLGFPPSTSAKSSEAEGRYRVEGAGDVRRLAAELRRGIDSVENRLFFQGRELDPATGLYDFRNRWYDPALGRFTSRDPLGYPDGPNQYAAFGADPVNKRDPMGTEALEIGVSASGRSAPGRMLDEDAFLTRLYQAGAQGGEVDSAIANAGYSGSRLRFHREFARGLAPAFAAYDAVDEAAGNYLCYWKGVGLAVPRLGMGLYNVGRHPVATAQGLATAAAHPIATGEAILDAAANADAGEALEFTGGAVGLWGAGAALRTVEGAAAVASVGQIGRARVVTPLVRRGTTWALQRTTASVNVDLAASPGLAAGVLSPAEYAVAQRLPFVARMQYGNAVERMVARRVRGSWLMDRLLTHVGGPGMPDFVGKSLATGLNFEITTPAAVARHLTRPYGPGLNIVTYERPVSFVRLP